MILRAVDRWRPGKDHVASVCTQTWMCDHVSTAQTRCEVGGIRWGAMGQERGRTGGRLDQIRDGADGEARRVGLGNKDASHELELESICISRCRPG